MPPFRSLLRSATVAATIALAPAVHAQLTPSVEAFVGYYRPLGHFDPASVYSTALPVEPSDLQSRTWGGTVRLAVGRRFGFAGQLAVAKSRIASVSTPQGPSPATNASVVIGLLLGQYDVSPRPHDYRIWVNAGPALVQHGGDAYRRYGSATSFGPALGMTIDVPLAAHLKLSADATGLFYTFDLPMPPEFSANPGPLEHGNQRDALLHLGIAWTNF